MTDAYETYDDVRARLDEIVDEVNAEGVGLDDALALYEEAVKLGLLACDLSEDDALALVDASDGEQDEGAAEAEGAQAAKAEVPAGAGAAAGVARCRSPRGAVRPVRGSVGAGGRPWMTSAFWTRCDRPPT